VLVTNKLTGVFLGGMGELRSDVVQKPMRKPARALVQQHPRHPPLDYEYARGFQVRTHFYTTGEGVKS